MSLTDDEDFKVVFLPSSESISLINWDSDFGDALDQLRLTAQRHTEAISLLTNTIMEIKTQLKE